MTETTTEHKPGNLEVMLESSDSRTHKNCTTYEVDESGMLWVYDRDGDVVATYNRDFWRAARIVEN